jgi:hypothetical protein
MLSKAADGAREKGSYSFNAPPARPFLQISSDARSREGSSGSALLRFRTLVQPGERDQDEVGSGGGCLTESGEKIVVQGSRDARGLFLNTGFARETSKIRNRMARTFPGEVHVSI